MILVHIGFLTLLKLEVCFVVTSNFEQKMLRKGLQAIVPVL